MELVFILSPLLSYNKMNRRYTKSRNLHMGTLLTGYALVPYALMIFVCGDSVAANPIQMVGTPVGGFKMCDETADCDVDKEYCDVNINRCGPCSVLCDEDRGLQNECLTHCRAYTLLLGKSTTSTTSEQQRITKTTTTEDSHVDSDIEENSFGVLYMVVIVAVIFIAFAITLLSTIFLQWKMLQNKKQQEAQQLSQKQKDNIYSADPTRKTTPAEDENLIPKVPLPSTSASGPLISANNRDEASSVDSGIMPDKNVSNTPPRFDKDITSPTELETAGSDFDNSKSISPKSKGSTTHTKRTVLAKVGDQESRDSGCQSGPSVQQTTGHQAKSFDQRNIHSVLQSEQSSNGRETSRSKSSSRPSLEKGSAISIKQEAGEKNHSSHSSGHDSNHSQKEVVPTRSIHKSGDAANQLAEQPDDNDLLKYDTEETSVYPSEPLPTPEKAEAKPYQKNKHIYELLRKIPWVEGYYSEGKSIQVYIDLLNLEPEWASKQLQIETGQPEEKFHIIHSAQLS